MDVFPKDSAQTHILYAPLLLSPIRAIYPAHLILLYFIAPGTFGGNRDHTAAPYKTIEITLTLKSLN